MEGEGGAQCPEKDTLQASVDLTESLPARAAATAITSPSSAATLRAHLGCLSSLVA